MGLLRWLRPGIGVKRWLLVLLISAAVIATGGLLLLPLAADLPALIGELGLEGRGVGAIFIAVGSLLLLVGAIGLARATLIPYRDSGEGGSLIDLLDQRRRQHRGLRIVVLGGGTGLATVLRGLKHETAHLTAIVSMGDDGGSSGRLRETLGIPPVGDPRNCLIALAEAEPTAGALLQYRLPAEPGQPRGHAVGNLLLAAAIAEEGGDLERGVERVHRVLHVRGRVTPATSVALHLRGETRDGKIIEGQAALARTAGILRIGVEPIAPPATQAALAAIRRADLLILGPGSLYTSLIPHLLVPGLRKALARRRAPLLWIANVDEQEGETEGLDLRDHLSALEAHGASGLVDAILAAEAPVRARPNATGTPLAPQLRPVDGRRVSDDPPLYVRDVVSRLRPHLHDPALLARAVVRLQPRLRRRRRVPLARG